MRYALLASCAVVALVAAHVGDAAFPGRNGLRLVQRYGPNDTLELAVRTTDGAIRQLTDNETDDYGPAWAPDGRRIAFVRLVRDESGDARLALFTIASNGSGERQLTRGHLDEWPSWSPDGTSIAFIRRTDNVADTVVLVGADGQAERVLFRIPGSSVASVKWSPDGRKLAYVSDLSAYVRDLRTGVTRRLTPKHYRGYAAVFDGVVDWSPDSRRVSLARTECVDADCREAVTATVVEDAQSGRVQREVAANCFPMTWSPRGWLSCGGGAIQPRCTIYGSDGADRIRGTAARDVICGERGNDRIDGRGGDDVIIGGAGNDTIVGGPGKDRLFGAWGDDRIVARDGTADVVDSGPGADRLTVDRRFDLVTG